MNPNSNTVIFTYDNKIYVPSGKDLPDHLIAHEQVHILQQNAYEGGADAWWSRYCFDQYFRIGQEVEAYAEQYKFLCKDIKDRNQRFGILRNLANSLAGPAYGGVISLTKAMDMIKSKSGIQK